MSYNVSYADEDIASHAEGNTDQASKYGDVFVEHYATDLMQVECQGTQCFVACSCKNDGPNDEDGWFETIEEAQHGDPNAQVYSIKSERHRSVSSALSLGTSSINDATADALTIGTSSMKNQTPIKASTRSDLAIDAPTIQTASASADYLTCYKKIPCPEGYFSTVPTSAQREAIEFYEDNSTGVTCYKPNYCKENNNYGYTSTNTGKASISYAGFPCYEEQNCYDVAPGTTQVKPTGDGFDYDVMATLDNGTECYGYYGCQIDWFPKSICDDYLYICDGISEEWYADTADGIAKELTETCYESTAPTDIYFRVYNVDSTNCSFATEYSVVDKEGSQFTAPDNLEGKSISLGIKCNEYTETYNTKVYEEYLDGMTTFNYQCNGVASVTSITIDGIPYSAGELLNLDFTNSKAGSHDVKVHFDSISDVSDKCITTCPEGYFPTEPTSAQREAMDFDEDTSTGITCYKPTCKDGYFSNSYCSSYKFACMNSGATYEGYKCNESAIPEYIDFYTTLNDPATCNFGPYYSIVNKNNESLISPTIDGSTVKLGITCGTEGETFNIALFNEKRNPRPNFPYTCKRGTAKFTSINIGGKTYTSIADEITLELDYAGTHTLKTRINRDMQGDQCMSQCPEGYFPTEADCKNEYAYMYGYAHTCVYDSSSKCYGKGTCPSGYFAVLRPAMLW